MKLWCKTGIIIDFILSTLQRAKRGAVTAPVVAGVSTYKIKCCLSTKLDCKPPPSEPINYRPLTKYLVLVLWIRFTLIRIQILLFTLMRIRILPFTLCGSGFYHLLFPRLGPTSATKWPATFSHWWGSNTDPAFLFTCPLASIKNAQATGEAFSAQKRTSST